ncbi:MAG: hypothetical protein ACLFWM_04980 [Actinomycetota bacterium]
MEPDSRRPSLAGDLHALGAAPEAPDESASGTESVAMELSISAVPTALDVLRSATGRLSHTMGFSYSGIEDLTMAVDEAATILLTTSPRELGLAVTRPRFDGPLHLTVTAGEPTKSLDLGELRAGYRWQLLEVLCEDVGWADAGTAIELVQTVR